MRRAPVASVFIAGLLMTFLAGCTYRLANYDGYRGDGTFTRMAAPSIAYKDGYRVDLGRVDLTSTASVDRRLDGLPPGETTIGVALSPLAASSNDIITNDIGSFRPSALVTLTLRDEKNHIVFSRQERLSDWVRFVPANDPHDVYLYQRGGFIDVAIAPDVVHHQHFPVGEDDSWGTCFTPRRGARYTLHFAVDEPDATSVGIDARLQVRAISGCL